MASDHGQVIRTYWTRPLDVEFDFQLDLLRRCIHDAAPARSGELRTAFNDPQSVIQTKPNEITVQVMPGPASRYARIQNQGGYVPPYNIRTAPPSPYLSRPRSSVMRAFIGGVWRYFVSRRGFWLKGSNYVYRGVMEWFGKLTGIGGQPVVKWASGHYSEGAQRLSNPRGTVST